MKSATESSRLRGRIARAIYVCVMTAAPWSAAFAGGTLVTALPPHVQQGGTTVSNPRREQPLRVLGGRSGALSAAERNALNAAARRALDALRRSGASTSTGKTIKNIEDILYYNSENKPDKRPLEFDPAYDRSDLLHPQYQPRVNIYESYYEQDPGGENDHLLAAALAHEMAHAAVSPDKAEIDFNNWWSCKSAFNWNEVRAHLAEAQMLMSGYDQLSKQLKKDLDDFFKALDDLLKFLQGKTKRELEDPKVQEELKKKKKAVEDARDRVLRTLRQMQQLVDKLRRLRDSLLNQEKHQRVNADGRQEEKELAYIKNYDPNDPNHELNQNQNKTIKDFVLGTLNTFLGRFQDPATNPLLQWQNEMQKWEGYLKHLDEYAKCDRNDDPDIPGKVRVTRENLQYDRDIPPLPKGWERLIAGALKRAGKGLGEKNSYWIMAEPFLENLASMANRDAAILISTRYWVTVRGADPVAEWSEHWVELEQGEVAWVESVPALGEIETPLLEVVVYDDAVYADIAESPDPFGTLLQRIVDGSVEVSYEGTRGAFEGIVGDLDRIRAELPPDSEFDAARTALAEAGSELATFVEPALWLGDVFPAGAHPGFPPLVAAAESTEEALAAWDGKKARKLRERTEESLQELSFWSQELVVEAAFFGLHKGIDGALLMEVLQRVAEGYDRELAGRSGEAVAAYGQAWGLLQPFGPNGGIGVPRLRTLEITSRSQPELNGWGTDPLASVTLFVDGLPVGETTARSSGEFQVAPFSPLLEGLHEATVVGTDTEGWEAESAPIAFLVDTFVDPPAILSPQPDSVISNPLPLITGAGTDPEAEVFVYLDDFILEGRADPVGSFEVEVTEALAMGRHRLSVRVVDQARNSVETDPMYFYVFARMVPPSLSAPLDGEVVWRGTIVPVAGVGSAPGLLVELLIDDHPTAWAVAEPDGAYAFAPVELHYGAHDVAAWVTDAAGVTHRTPTADILVYDNPGDLLITSPQPGPPVPREGLVVEGETARKFSRVAVYVDDRYYGEAEAERSGTFAFEVPETLAAGPHKVSAIGYDKKGERWDIGEPVEFEAADVP
jgi:hypothetical protein